MAKLQWCTDDRLCPAVLCMTPWQSLFPSNASYEHHTFLWTSHLLCGVCNHLRCKSEPGTMTWRLKEDMTCISDFSKFRNCECPCHPNSCRTSVELHLTSKVNCLLTIFIVIFANGCLCTLCLVAMQSIVWYRKQTRLYLEQMRTVHVNRSSTMDSSNINQCLLDNSTSWPAPAVKFVYVNCIKVYLYELTQICNKA